jgi:hypothetical protein
MNAKRNEPLLSQVRKKIEKVGERDAFAALIKAGVSISLATKLVANRYRANGLRDATRDKLEKFLSEAS